MTEYYLQKKAFNSWSHVTWYPTEEECRKNFDKVATPGNGYSWRMVKVDTIEERLLHDETPVMRPEPEDIQTAHNLYKEAVNKVWTTPESGWAGAASGKSIVDNSARTDHGMTGKVWLGNPVTKEKKRVEPALVAGMMADGWVKAGPRTVL